MLGALSDFCGETTVNLGFLVSVMSVFGSALVGAVVTIVTQGSTIKHLRRDLDTMAESAAERDKKIRDLENWRVREEALDGVRSSGSTARGTRPYPRG